jgi:hypothetical protein
VAAGDVRASGRARSADRVEFVDEDDRRGFVLGLLEQVTHPRGANPDDHLDELGGRDLKERHAGLPRHRAGHQRLPGARTSGQQHAARHPAPQPGEPGRVAQEVDDLGQVPLGLVDPGHVVEGHPHVLALGPPRPRLAKAHQPAGAATLRRGAAQEPSEQEHEQDRRAEPDQHAHPRRRPGVDRFGVDGDVVGS